MEKITKKYELFDVSAKNNSGITIAHEEIVAESKYLARQKLTSKMITESTIDMNLIKFETKPKPKNRFLVLSEDENGSTEIIYPGPTLRDVVQRFVNDFISIGVASPQQRILIRPIIVDA